MATFLQPFTAQRIDLALLTVIFINSCFSISCRTALNNLLTSPSQANNSPCFKDLTWLIIVKKIFYKSRQEYYNDHVNGHLFRASIEYKA